MREDTETMCSQQTHTLTLLFRNFPFYGTIFIFPMPVLLFMFSSFFRYQVSLSLFLRFSALVFVSRFFSSLSPSMYCNSTSPCSVFSLFLSFVFHFPMYACHPEQIIIPPQTLRLCLLLGLPQSWATILLGPLWLLVSSKTSLAADALPTETLRACSFPKTCSLPRIFRSRLRPMSTHRICLFVFPLTACTLFLHVFVRC
jgi:hypothetical protein